MVAVAAGGGAQRGHVAAGLGLGEGEAEHRGAASGVRQERPLGGAAGQGQRLGAQALDGEDRVGPRGHVAEHLPGQAQPAGIEPAPRRRDTPGDAFAEVAALSDVLGEPDFAVDLFARLDEQAPETAADCAIAAHRLLMRAGRYDLARRHLTDPLGKVGRLADVLQMRLARNPGLLSEAVRESRRGEAVRDYVAGVQEVLTLLRASGDDELAEATRRKAVADVVWGHLRDEVEQALPPPSRG